MTAIDLLKVHTFNVGHGDSSLLEFYIEDKETPLRVLIDSNTVSGRIPAVEYLKSVNAETIDTYVITHFHHDHYSGSFEIFNGFNVKKLIIPPFFSTNSEHYKKRLKRFRDAIRKITDGTCSNLILNQMKDLSSILVFIDKNCASDGVIEEAIGRESILRLPGTDLEIGRIFLPLPMYKGIINHYIDSGEFKVEDYKIMNDSSVALMIEVAGFRLLFAADSTLAQWESHRNQMARYSTTNLSVDWLKVSHHGSQHNNNEELFRYIFRQSHTSKYAIITANGRSHPSEEFFRLVNSFENKPYCTNISTLCFENVSWFKDISREINPIVREMIKHYEISTKPTPCQGDIITEIDVSKKTLQVFPSILTPCPYRQTATT